MARYIAAMTVRVRATNGEDARDLIDRAAKLLIDSEWVDALVVADPVRITAGASDPTEPPEDEPEPVKLADWCDVCKDDPAGVRWLCPNRANHRPLAAAVPLPLAFGGMALSDQRFWIGALIVALVVAIVVAVAVSWHRTDDYDRRLYDHEHDWKSKW
jgi:hypothetical protein